MKLFRLFIFNELKISTLVDGIYIFVSENLQKVFDKIINEQSKSEKST